MKYQAPTCKNIMCDVIFKLCFPSDGHFSKDELDILRKDLLEHQRKAEEFSAAMKEHQKPGKAWL